MKRHPKRLLDLLLIPIAAAFVFIEETLIRYLGVAMAALARLAPVARLEAWLRTLSPRGAMLAFLAPSLILLPVKLAVLWFGAQGRFVLALAAVLLGKLIGTALVARAYHILRPTLVQMRWFAVSEAWLFRWRDRIYGFVRALAAWQKARSAVQRLRERLRGMASGWFAR